jgi:hypothetical protein
LKIYPTKVEHQLCWVLMLNNGRMLTARTWKEMTGEEVPGKSLFSRTDDFKTMYLPTEQMAEECLQKIKELL